MDLTLALTHNCNLACTYCYAGRKKRISMSKETAEKAVKFALSFDAEKMQLGFFGGEPLLEWELLKWSTELAEELTTEKDITLKKTVTTNASLLTPDKASWLKEHGFYLGVSIDGNQSMHDKTRPFTDGNSSFEVCLKGLENALKIMPELSVVIVPDPANVCEMAESVRFLMEEKNVRRVSINPNFYTNWDETALTEMGEAFEEIGAFYERRYLESQVPYINFIDNKIITNLKKGFQCEDKCNFGEHEIAVAPSGRIYPCERLVGEDDGGEMCIGDIDNGFDLKKRDAILSQRGNINSDCLTCSIRKRCMNWCCCINYALTGAINTTDGIVCFHEQLAVRVADRVATKLFKEGCAAFLRRFYHEDFKADNL